MPMTRARGSEVRLVLKPLARQVIVITGASSGIGLVTARLAAKRGARVVLGARNGQALQKLASEIERAGGEVAYVTVDVGDPADMEQLAAIATNRFGRIDTWVNNAGVSIYGLLEETPLEDMRQLFQTNFWGIVHGSLAALPRLKRAGGALINLGSVVSDRAVPLQGAYSASKHAVKGFTDALRMELEKEGAPVSVTLIKPAAIDTLFTANAKNLMSAEPSLPPPVYAPEVVAEAILHAAQHPERDVYCGGAARVMAAFGHWAPRLMDRYMQATMFGQQQRGPRLRAPDEHSLYVSRADGRARRGDPAHVSETSVYTRMVTTQRSAALAALGVLAVSGVLWRARRPKRSARR
ncbi:MAG: SDR family oxidoreductase [Pseudomonadota bacterium]|nr:SDR family oxidoreductase [Pseudomonadota bacterium]